MGEWKADIRASKELGDKTVLSNDQLVTTLIGMLPNSSVDDFITKHDITNKKLMMWKRRSTIS